MAKVAKKDKAELTASEALELLSIHLEGKKKRVHSYDGGYFGILMGCDIDLSDLKKRFDKAEHLCLSGPNMRAQRHGVAYKEKDKAYLFLETDSNKLDAIYKKRKIVG